MVEETENVIVSISEQPKRVFTPEFETNLRESICWQMENPTDMSNASSTLSEDNKIFLGYHTVNQEKATITNLTDERVSRWFEIVREEFEAAPERFPEGSLDHIDWEEIKKHEIQGHLAKAVEVGCSVEKHALGVHFGKQIDQSGKSTDKLDFEISVSPDSDELHELNPVDRAAIWLAPDKPSMGDLIRFTAAFQMNMDSFGKRPVDTTKLLKKFSKATKIGTAGLFRFMKESRSIFKNEKNRIG